MAPLFLATLLIAGCANISVQRIGTAAYAPLSRNSEILVYTDESQIKQSFEVVGIISYTNPGKYQVLTLGDAIEPLKEKAGEVGANAIILGQSQRIKSGIISTGIAVDARAVRLGGNGPPSTQQLRVIDRPAALPTYPGLASPLRTLERLSWVIAYR